MAGSPPSARIATPHTPPRAKGRLDGGNDCVDTWRGVHARSLFRLRALSSQTSMDAGSGRDISNRLKLQTGEPDGRSGRDRRPRCRFAEDAWLERARAGAAVAGVVQPANQGG